MNRAIHDNDVRNTLKHLKFLKRKVLNVILLLLPFPSVVNVAAAQHITCILCLHSSLDSATANELLSSLRRHLVETLHLQLKLMHPTHLSNKDLPFMQDALLMISKMLMLALELTLSL